VLTALPPAIEAARIPGAGLLPGVASETLESLNSRIRGKQVKLHSALKLVQGVSERGAGEGKGKG